MNIVVSLPDSIAQSIGKNEREMKKKVLESLALEGFRSEELTAFQVGEMLGLETRMQVDGFLKKHKIFIEYSTVEIEEQRKILRDLLKKK